MNVFGRKHQQQRQQDQPQLPPKPASFLLRGSASAETPPSASSSFSNGSSAMSNNNAQPQRHQHAHVTLNGERREIDLAELRLPALAQVNVLERTLVLRKSVQGDFGFSLRRVVSAGSGGRPTVFAEPITSRVGPPRPEELRTCLLPGDQLLQVNGHAVAALSREQLLEVVRSSGDTIELVVRSVPELADLCATTGRPQIGHALDLPTIEGVAVGQTVTDEERAWILHRGGYALARILQQLADGRMKVQVGGGRELIVEADEVERAGPAHLDRADDLLRLRFLNETSVIHTLRTRLGSSLAYTRGGPWLTVCATQPFEANDDSGGGAATATGGGGGGALHDQLAQLFRAARSRRTPAHIYATAQHVYRNIQSGAQSQSLVLSGVSGSGKSRQLRSLAHFLCTTAGWTGVLPYERVARALSVLEAFGCAATLLHSNSTRHAMQLQLGFDRSAAIRAARVSSWLLEAQRVWPKSRRPGEGLFHVFHLLLEGAEDGLLAELQLRQIEPTVVPPTRYDADPQTHRIQTAEAFVDLCAALESIGLAERAQMGVWRILAAILHLCQAEATPTLAVRAQWLRANEAATAAQLLGISLDALADAVFRPQRSNTSTSSPLASLPLIGGGGGGAGIHSTATGTPKQKTASDAIGRFSMSNRALLGPDALAGFCSALYQHLFSALIAHINAALACPQATSWISILDLAGASWPNGWSTSTPVVYGNLADLAFNYANERVQELLFDTHFTEQANVYAAEQVDVDVQTPAVGPHQVTRALDVQPQLVHSADLERRAGERRGVLSLLEEEALFPGASDDSFLQRLHVHFTELNEPTVRRSATGRRLVVMHGAGAVQQEYDVEGWVRSAQPNPAVLSLPTLLRDTTSSDVRAALAPVQGEEATASRLRRITQAVQQADVAGRLLASSASATFASSLVAQMEQVVSSVRRAGRLHWVHCVAAHVPAAVMTSNPTAGGRSTDVVDVHFVRAQLRAVQLLDSLRAQQRGFPERQPLRSFRRRFDCLVAHHASAAPLADALDDRAAAARILEAAGVQAHRYRLGISQILLRADVAVELEERRDAELSGVLASFQAACRRHLASRWLARRRTQETAIRCIQKNGLAWLRVREWSWWRLYTRVLPLLAVAREDDNQREWNEKLHKLQAIIQQLRVENSRLESRVAEMSESSARDARAADELGRAFESQIQQRSQLEQQLSAALQRLATQEESATVVAETRRVDEMTREVERARESETTHKEKARKVGEQLAEMQHELTRLAAANQMLEQKQAGVDSSTATSKAEVATLKTQNETLERYSEQLKTAVANKSAALQAMKEENGELHATAARLRRELDELGETTARGGANDAELVTLRAGKRQLEEEVKHLKEELEESEDSSKQLEQTVMRLEMAAERTRNEAVRAAESREQETDELRAQFQRRLRAAEQQLLDAQDAHAALAKHARLLEQRLRSADSTATTVRVSGSQTKRDLEKALALLADTQAVLAHERQSAPSLALIRQLREQVDAAEMAKMAALKGRHSLESELSHMRTLLEESLAARKAAEERVLSLLKERNTATAEGDEKDDLIAQLMKKLKASVQQQQIDSITIRDQIEQIAELEKSKQRLAEELNTVLSAAEFSRQHTVEKHRLLLAEQKVRDLEARLDLALLTQQRLESSVARLSDELEEAREVRAEAEHASAKDAELVRRLRRELQHAQEALAETRKTEAEVLHKLKQATSEAERAEDERRSMAADLKLAQKRIDSLQAAFSVAIEGADDEEDDELRSRSADSSSRGINEDEGVHADVLSPISSHRPPLVAL